MDFWISKTAFEGKSHVDFWIRIAMAFAVDVQEKEEVEFELRSGHCPSWIDTFWIPLHRIYAISH